MKPDNMGGFVTEVTKASPPVGVTALVAGGIPLQDWVLILTLIYTVLQITFLILGKIRKTPNGS